MPSFLSRARSSPNHHSRLFDIVVERMRRGDPAARKW